MRVLSSVVAFASLGLSLACGANGSDMSVSSQSSGPVLRDVVHGRLDHDARSASRPQPGGETPEEAQLMSASQLLRDAMARGDVVANPHNESGRDPYAFVSEASRERFSQHLENAGLQVSVSLPTLNECASRGAFGKAVGGEDVTAQAQSSCGPGCVYQTVGYCEGALLDGVINNLGYKYGAYTYAFNYIPGSMVPFSAELSLPYTSSAGGDYNYSYTAPRELYYEKYSNLTSANRSKHRCCYWFWGSPSWTIQCSPYFYNQL